MSLYLTEADVDGLLAMPVAIDCLEEAFSAQARGEAVNMPRSRIPLARGSYNLMSAAWHGKGVVGQKSYTAARGGVGFHVLLYSTTGEGLLAVIEANRMGQIRTGAASGLASKYMARRGSRTAAIIGSGYQARTQLEAIAAVLHTDSARVYSRAAGNREEFATRMSKELEIPVSAVGTVEECVDGADVIILMTSATEPVLTGDLVRPGVHINAAGANGWLRRELDTRAVSKAGVIATDDVSQAQVECADLMRAVEAGRLTWQQVKPLASVVAGETPARRQESDVTLFESQGVALEDIAVGERVYRMALERGVGVQLS